ncbi:PAS domain S-box protein [bacterium]|nr:PAS domain S-box protein [candidate division CSSED10-310 bacterium]
MDSRSIPDAAPNSPAAINNSGSTTGGGRAQPSVSLPNLRRQRLLAALLIATAVALGGSLTVLISWPWRCRNIHDYRQYGQLFIDTMAANLANGDAQEPGGYTAALDRLKAIPHFRFAALVGQDGSLLTAATAAEIDREEMTETLLHRPNDGEIARHADSLVFSAAVAPPWADVAPSSLVLVLAAEGVIGSNQAMAISLLAIGATALVVFLSIAGTALYFTKPLRRLHAAAHRLTLGDYDEPLIGAYEGELGRLAEIMDTLRREIGSREQQLKDWTKTLEQRVEANTEELRKSERKYRDVIENSSDMIHSLDAESRWLASNRREQELLGWNLEELLAMRYADIVVPADRNRFLEHLRRTVEGEEIHNLTLRILTRHRAERTISMNANAIRNEHGAFVATRSFVRDISDRIAFEARLIKQKLEMEKSILELDEFTYVVSHDLKEPLRGFEAFSKFLLEDYGDKLDEEGRKYLEALRRNSIRMKKMIDDLLLISRLSRQRQHFQHVSVSFILRELIECMTFSLQEKQARIIIPPNLPMIECEPIRIRELFANFISNAVKFNDKEEPLIEILYVSRGEYHQFGVKDNGIGIEPRYHDKIFGMFQRLHHHEDYEGTGAGLAICSRIVEMYGGRIWVTSSQGKGATFHFTLLKTPSQLV